MIEAAFGQPDEARLAAALDEAGDAVISLVAVERGAVIGHILLSELGAPFPALALAPLSVLPEFQGRAVGASLIRAAIDAATSAGARGIFLLGDAEYYGRFGFAVAPARGFASPFAGPHMMVLPLNGPLPATSGKITYAPAFAALS